MRDSADGYWNSQWLALVLLAGSLIQCGRYISHTPPPGYAIAFLAFVAAVISVRDNSPFQKFVWLVVLGLLLRVEFKAIRIDHEASAREQQSRFSQQEQEFGTIAGSILESIKLNDSAFKDAADKAQAILSSANDSAIAANTAIAEITGKDTYPFVSAQVQVDSDDIPLTLWSAGPNMLTNVSVTIHRNSDFGAGDDLAFVKKPSSDISVVHEGWPKILRETIKPHLDPGRDHDQYTITIYTQKALYIEELFFAPSKDYPSGWESTFYVSVITFKTRRGGSNPAVESITRPFCRSSGLRDSALPLC